jgi:hypothetical protein
VAKIEVVYDPAPKSLLTVFLYCFKPFSANKQTKKNHKYSALQKPATPSFEWHGNKS